MRAQRKWTRSILAATFALACIGFASAQTAPLAVDQRAVMAASAPQTLAAYRFFTDAGAKAPNAGVTPYDLNTPLYSDGALKFRYLYLPPNTQATYREDAPFDFPVGAVLIKTFAFAADMAHPDQNLRFLETRLLIHHADGWQGLAYVWNDAQTEARLSVIGATVPVSFKDADGHDVAFDWAVPNRNQCAGCHAREGGHAVLPLGPRADNLNRDDQLPHWRDAHLIDTLPANVPRFAAAYDPASGTLDQRARAYLQVNCAHCHNPNGPAHTSGLDLRYSDTDPAHWGVLKRPVAAGRGSSTMDFDIAPGQAEQSIMIYRMHSTDPGEMMPELGRQRVDERAVALMREWIADMGPDGRPKSAH